MSDYIVDINQDNAQQVLIDESMNRPVVVDFWSGGAEASMTLSPVLEKLANEYQGQFVLARVNVDDQQGAAIAQQLGVRGLPTVMVLKEGQPVDGFAGEQPEPQIRDMLDKYLPKPWDSMLLQAKELIAGGDFAAAMPLLRQAWQDSGERHDITLAYVGVLIDLNRLDEAQSLLDGIRMADQDAGYEQLVAQLKLKREAAKSPEIEALEAQLAEDPNNLDLMAQLSVQFSNAGMHKEAMETLICILQVDKEHAGGDTRKTLLDIIASLGKGDPLAVEYQRKLFGLMY